MFNSYWKLQGAFNYCLYCQIFSATSQKIFDVRLGDTMSRLLETPHSLPPHDLSRFIWLVLRSVYKSYYTTAILYSVNKLSYTTTIFCVLVANTVFCIPFVLRHCNVVHLLLDMCRKIYIFVPLLVCVPPDILMDCIISDRPIMTIKSWRSTVQMTKWTKLLYILWWPGHQQMYIDRSAKHHVHIRTALCCKMITAL